MITLSTLQKKLDVTRHFVVRLATFTLTED